MINEPLASRVKEYLAQLCLEIPSRRVGSQGNRAATDYFARVIASFGFQTECPEFDCLDWVQEGAQLLVGSEPFEALVSPYSPGCHSLAPLSVVSAVEELEASRIADVILLLRGEIAKEQLMPKRFPFYNPDEHQRIIRLLETKQPKAIIAATACNPELAGAMYPFPLIEDGDFDIPSVYMTEEVGERLAKRAGEQVALEIRARRIPAKGRNVEARKGVAASRRVVLTAHIDSKDDTPGALDNAAGVVTLLLLAELLEGDDFRLGIEIVAINGEDHYSAAGEVQYLQRNQGKLGEVLLNINLDAVGYVQGATAFSLYECPAEIASLIRKTFSTHPAIVEGDAWYQGDHMAFVQNQVPAMAITTQEFVQLASEIAHTPKDRPELVDAFKLVEVAIALRELLLGLDQLTPNNR